jgi:hypothetical protein
MNRPSDTSIPPRPVSARQAAEERAPSQEDLNAPQTQVVADRDAYLGQGRHDVGRRISDDQVELFISGDLAQSLQQEFSRHAPEFIALHDVGTSASLRLLASMANPAGARVQRLSVRRQGHGVALAVLQFVEVPLADGTPVRVYSTDISTEAAVRAQVARVLLAHSRLGVLMVGELPSHSLAAQLNPLRDAMLRGPWPNRDLLMVPLGSGIALAAQASQLAGLGGVAVHVTPHAAKPKHVWTFIGGAWNRLNAAVSAYRTLPTEMTRAVPRPAIPPTEAATQPMDLQPLSVEAATRLLSTPDRRRPGQADGTTPALPPQNYASSRPPPVVMPLPAAAPMPMPIPGGTRWQAYADRCALIKGTMSCCVFDMHSSQSLASSGGPPAAERLALQGSALLATMGDAARALGLGQAKAEAAISTGGHHLLIRPVPGHPGVAIFIVILASAGNLTLARMQLERIESPQ